MNTANLFTAKGHRVTLLILDETSNSFYPIDSSVEIIRHPFSFGITPEGNIISRKIKLLSDILKLRKVLKQLQPCLIIATEYPFAAAAILSGARKYSKVVSWEHHHFFELKKNLFWEKVFRLTYPKLDAVVCLNEDEKLLFGRVNKNPVVIPNFISGTGIISSISGKTILTVARLTAVKGIDLLLQTAKIVLRKHPEWKWKIIGDGDMKEDFILFTEKEGLQNKLINQPPVDHNIISEYQGASIYVMTSRNECFPMTLLEAMSFGLPCIVFDCETGPRHIISNQEDGLLIEKENPAKLAEAISSLIDNEILRKKMGERALENVQRFSPEIIYKLWESLF
ncbi:MAG: glycosyltransferase family 4 protein [Chitinophagaceae bacterium]|nr:glycosyltransferase family 4 protein [Chitinophagaceae bacterium]